MSVLFSRQCEYALQAVTYLALKREGEMTPIRELTRSLRIPYHFAAKILQRLTRKGLLVSLKGPAGGFALAMQATEITLFHVVEAVDGVEFTQRCVLGFPECSGMNPCAVHETWGEMRDRIYSMLAGKSIDEIARDMKKPEYGLAPTRKKN